MNKLKDIVCYNKFYDKAYEKKEIVGKIVLKDDNSFEGMVRDTHLEENCFVFGTMTDQLVQLFKCSIDDFHLPKQYKAKKEEDIYYGRFFDKGQSTDRLRGRFMMEIVDPLTWRDADVKKEIKSVEKAAEYFKNKQLGSRSQIIYKGINNHR